MKLVEQREESNIQPLSGHGQVYAGGKLVANVHYTLTVTGSVVVGSAAAEDDPGTVDVSGKITVVDADVRLPARDEYQTMTLGLEDGRRLDFTMTKPVPGGLLIEGTSGIYEEA
jgi:hypothetical protein